MKQHPEVRTLRQRDDGGVGIYILATIISLLTGQWGMATLFVVISLLLWW